MSKLGLLGVIVFISILSCIGCYKDKEDTTEIIIKENPRVIIESVNIISNIVDENGNALEGITAKYGESIKVVTKSNYFHFTGHNVNKYFERLEITDKDGEKYHFNLSVIENDVCYFNPVLFKSATKLIRSSNEDTKISLSSALSLNIPSKGYKKSNDIYQGEVHLRYTYFDMKNSLHRQALPGGLIAQNESNESVMLLIHEAFKIEALTPENQILEFTPQCKLDFNAPNLALYHYNEDLNNWVYVSSLIASPSITKSGIYCIAASQKYHFIKGQLLSNDTPNPNVKVTFKVQNFTYHTYTSNEGKWEAVVPNDMAVAMTYELICQQPSKELEPTNKDVTYGPDFIDNGMEVTHFKGTIIDCDGKTIPNSFIKIRTGYDEKVIFIKDGNIDLHYPHCNTDKIYVTSINNDFTQASNEIRWEKGVQNNIYSSYACDAYKVTYAIIRGSNQSKIYTNGTSSFSDGKTTLSFNELSSGATLQLTFKSNEVGKVDPSLVNITWTDNSFAGSGYSIYCPTSSECGFETMELTQYATEKGGLIRGYFKGVFWLKTLQPLTASNKVIEGEFQLIRDF